MCCRGKNQIEDEDDDEYEDELAGNAFWSFFIEGPVAFLSLLPGPWPDHRRT
jgi:hypothetical protein